MDFYPKSQTQQLAPVIAVNLGDEPYVPTLRRHFDAANIRDKVWDSSILKNRLLNTRYILQYHESESEIRAQIEAHKVKQQGTHSHLSPFHAGSDIFPNGILSSKWFDKYTAELPFAVISVVLLGSRTDDETLGAQLAQARTKYADYGVKFVAVITSSEANADAVADRTALLRQISGLARLSGLYYLNTDPQTLDRDSGVLASTLFNNLKASATDFYSAIEHRVKQRYRKYYSIPAAQLDTKIAMDPRFLEIRNLIKQAMLSQLIHPHNVESSLSTLEHAYESLIEVLREIFPVLASGPVSDHDAISYKQFRNLLDIIAIHIIRGYISIEEPVAALRKHDAHIANVIDVAQPIPSVDHNVWLAIQYQWLAELLRLVPNSALTDIQKVTKGKNKSNQKRVPYYGGITFHDTFFSRVVTDPSLLFLKAFRQSESASLSDSPLAYLEVFSNQQEIKEYQISLLEKAKRPLADGDSAGSLKTLDYQLDWLIGDVYVSIGDYAKALDHYHLSLNLQGKTPWTTINDIITKKILLALTHLKDENEYLRQVAKLSTLKSGHSSKLGLPLLQLLQPEYEINVEEGQFLNIGLFLYEKGMKSEVHAYDSIITQIEIDSTFDFQPLKSLILNSLVEILAERIDVNYVDRGCVTLKRGSSTESKLEEIKIDLNDEHFASLDDLLEGKIIKLEDVVSLPGSLEIDKVTVHLKVRIRAPKVTVNLIHSEVHEFDALQIVHSRKIIEKRNDKIESVLVRLDARSPYKLDVLPYRPDIGMKMSFPFSTIIVGEKLDVHFEISHRKSLAQIMNFSSVTLQARTIVLENDVEKEELPVQSNWELLKDDEPLNILDIINSDLTSCARNLRMSIRKPPSTLNYQKDLKVLLEIKLHVTEASGVESVYDVETYLLPIVLEPFKTRLSISPKGNLDGDLGMPNPFVLGIDSGNPGKDYSMPLPSRTWRANVSLVDHLNLIDSGDIEFAETVINLKSKNAEIIVEPIDSATMVGSQARQLFTTKSKHRFTDRNVAVLANAIFSWKRKGDSHTNHYETDEWEISLPLQDPRVLLQIKNHEGNQLDLHYTIENPTPRILTFTTSLTTDELALQGTNWNFEYPQNLSPLKQSAFPVLPFSHFVANFHCSYELDEKKQDIQLPQFQVYDVNYKVSLPTLALDDEVTPDKSALFIREIST